MYFITVLVTATISQHIVFALLFSAPCPLYHTIYLPPIQIDLCDHSNLRLVLDARTCC